MRLTDILYITSTMLVKQFCPQSEFSTKLVTTFINPYVMSFPFKCHCTGRLKHKGRSTFAAGRSLAGPLALFYLSFNFDILPWCHEIKLCILNHLSVAKCSAVFQQKPVITSNSDGWIHKCDRLMSTAFQSAIKAPTKTRLAPQSSLLLSPGHFTHFF